MGRGHDDSNVINSEQEDLVGTTSSSDLDDADDDDEEDDMSDTALNGNSDTQHFNIFKTTTSLSLIDLATDWNTSGNCDDYQNLEQQQNAKLQHYRKCRKTLLLLIAFGLGLLVTSFSLFIILPLYQKQLEISRKTNNAYGSILFISPIVTILLVILTYFLSWACKWTKFHIYKFPLPIKRLLVISLCCGFAGTFCIVSSYKRVPCHLQDPLKGVALVYSLIFYFFFCKRVMGLQKIFSATTAVVGLFISVDYGLCDEYRCHGNDITGISIKPSSFLEPSPTTSTILSSSNGWQGRAFWTLLYVVGIMLWTLHLSLLEGNLVMLSNTSHSPPPKNLLTTISRLVSNSDYSIQNSRSVSSNRSLPPKYRPKPMHIVVWIHIISLLTLLIFGLIDAIPNPGHMQSFAQHWTNTGNTFLCHFGIEPNEFHLQQKARAHETLEYLSNLTPGSILYNKTVQKLRKRDKRDILQTNHYKFFHHRLGHHFFTPEHQHVNERNHTLYAFKKYKNHTSTQTPLISRLILNSDSGDEHDTGTTSNCYHLRSYTWIFIAVYVAFILCTFHFLDISESAVFTIAIITGSLPFMGLFWSSFRMRVNKNTASIIWAPSISGELICSLLGTPIVFLGLILLYRAHFSDLLRPSTSSSTSSSSNTLRTASSNSYTNLPNT